MGNPFYETINQRNNPTRQIFNTYNQLNNANPKELLMQMAKNNPQAQFVLSALNSGTNPQQLFFELCKQKNVNPNDILKSLTGK